MSDFHEHQKLLEEQRKILEAARAAAMAEGYTRDRKPVKRERSKTFTDRYEPGRLNFDLFCKVENQGRKPYPWMVG